MLAGFGTTAFEAQPSITAPLVEKIPVVVGVYMSPEFRDKVHKEKHEGGSYEIAIGKAQSEGFMRLMNAMFDRVVPVDATDAGARTDPQIRGVIEPVLEDLAFVTPVESGTDAYAVSLRYRFNGYRPDGQAIDSWTFTGYGASRAEGLLGIGQCAEINRWDWLPRIRMGAADVVEDSIARHGPFDLLYLWLSYDTYDSLTTMATTLARASRGLRRGGDAFVVGPVGIQAVLSSEPWQLCWSESVAGLPTFTMHKTILPNARLKTGLTLFHLRRL